MVSYFVQWRVQETRQGVLCHAHCWLVGFNAHHTLESRIEIKHTHAKQPYQVVRKTS